VRQQLGRIVADSRIAVLFIDNDGKLLEQAPTTRSHAPPPLSPELFDPLRRLVASTWPNLKVLPTMMVGASDGIITMEAGMPTFMIAPIPRDRRDSRAHGRDERLSIEGFYAGNEFFYRYIRTLTTH
jgi:acetylornithine deacetylase/succinyl-diaminopimelate desuccinylase-like protein